MKTGWQKVSMVTTREKLQRCLHPQLQLLLPQPRIDTSDGLLSAWTRRSCPIYSRKVIDVVLSGELTLQKAWRIH